MINGFTLHDAATAPAASVEILSGIQKTWGFVPNLHRVLAESPVTLGVYSTLWGMAEKTGFTAQERGIAYLAISHQSDCAYCLATHTHLSRQAKIDDAVIAAVRENRPIADAKLEALREFAAKVSRQCGTLSEADVAAFKAAGYDNRAVLDLLVLAAITLMSSQANHLADPPNDSLLRGKLNPAA